jgi:hypothetical protein
MHPLGVGDPQRPSARGFRLLGFVHFHYSEFKGSMSVSEVELELNIIRSYTLGRWSGIVINHHTTMKIDTCTWNRKNRRLGRNMG